MNTTPVNIRTELYNHVADYARRKHTSVDEIVESYIATLLMPSVGRTSQKYRHLSPVVERLGSLSLREFSQEELEQDPRLAHIMEREEQ